jgi:hypothetical protein
MQVNAINSASSQPGECVFVAWPLTRALKRLAGCKWRNFSTFFETFSTVRKSCSACLVHSLNQYRVQPLESNGLIEFDCLFQ